MRSSSAEILRRVPRVSTAAERAADWWVGLFSKKDRLLRSHRRLMERDPDYHDAFIVALGARGYESAKSHTNQTPWLNATGKDADGEILPDMKSMRNRSRAAEKDDAIGTGIFNTRRKKVVGSGLRLQVRHANDKAKDDALESVWKSRKDKLFPAEGDLTQCQAQKMIFTRKDVDGDILLKPAVGEPGEPVWVELVEADRITDPLGVTAEQDGRISGGVEKDAHGRVVAYWVSKTHPGDQKTIGHALQRSNFARVPKGIAKLLRSKVSRPGQSRGLQLLHAVLQDVRDLDLVILATLKRTQVAACLALFITSSGDMADLFDATAEDYGYQLNQKLEPGMIFKLYPGEEVQTLSPKLDVPDLNPLVWLLCRRIGVAIGMSPHAVLNEWGEGISYSAARTIKIEDDETHDAERRDFSVDCLDWLARLVWTDALMRGDERMAGFTAQDIETVPTQWIGDVRAWVDPAKSALAIEKLLELKLTTHRDEALKRGLDWEEVLVQQLVEEKREIDLRVEMKLPPAAAEPTGAVVPAVVAEPVPAAPPQKKAA